MRAQLSTYGYLARLRVREPEFVDGRISDLEDSLNRSVKRLIGHDFGVKINLRQPRKITELAETFVRIKTPSKPRDRKRVLLQIEVVLPLGEQPAETAYRIAQKLSRTIFPPPAQSFKMADFPSLSGVGAVMGRKAKTLWRSIGERNAAGLFIGELKATLERHLYPIAAAKLRHYFLPLELVPEGTLKSQLGASNPDSDRPISLELIETLAFRAVCFGRAFGRADLAQGYKDILTGLRQNNPTEFYSRFAVSLFDLHSGLFDLCYRKIEIPGDKYTRPEPSRSL